jgi:hypothetical protein
LNQIEPIETEKKATTCRRFAQVQLGVLAVTAIVTAQVLGAAELAAWLALTQGLACIDRIERSVLTSARRAIRLVDSDS